MTDNFIHKQQASKILGITEPELMTLVSDGRLTGFDQNRHPVKHYGCYHVDQTEDDRLTGAVLSSRISYFDRGDIEAFASQNDINIQELFPNLNLPLLKVYAKRWVDELPGIRSVKLYPYRSYLSKEHDRKSSVKYAIVLDGDTEKLWDAITDDQSIYSKLIDSRFADVYKFKPDGNYRRDWFFTTSALADGNDFSSIMTDEPYCLLWPDEPTKESTPAPQTEPQAENCFKRSENGDFWTIRFKGKESNPIKDVKGLYYIAYLLQRPGKSISSMEFYTIVTANTQIEGETMGESAAINEGLNIGRSKQPINDKDARKAYWKQWQKYQDIIDEAENTPEGDMIKEEYLQKQDELEKRLHERDFTGESAKKQTLIHDLLKTAYKNIEKDRNMGKCVEHFHATIKTDGAYGYTYTGEMNWEIFL